MPSDPALLRSIAALVENDPANTALRLHLADLLLTDGQPAEALTHVMVVLSARPDDVQALQLAARASAATGDAAKAESYERIARVLGSPDAVDTSAPPKPAEPAAPRATDTSPPGRVALRLVEGNRVADPEPDVEVHEPVITLRDVTGMEAVKHRLNLAFLAPLRNPELRRTFGKSLRGGLLLYGPPGCGKTFIRTRSGR